VTTEKSELFAMAKLKIAILNVGHGDFVYAVSPTGHNLIIDCGDGEEIVPSKFLSKVASISELQVSHPHTDHFSDIAALSTKTIHSFRTPNPNNFEEKLIGWRKSDSSAIRTLKSLYGKNKADNNAVPFGGGFSHTVWNPTNVDFKDPNTASLVTVLAFHDFKILFGADLPTAGWEALLKKDDFVKAIRGTTVYKVAHHGRKVGYSEALFKVISPMLCVISDKTIDDTNENTVATNYYSQKASGALVANLPAGNNTRKVLTTRSDGSIFIEADEKNWWVYKDTNWKSD
jgi:competence protein ComEC